MDEPEVFVLADQTFLEVIKQVTDDQWELQIPEWFQKNQPGKLTLKELVNYHAYDDAWVPDMLADKTMDEVGKEAFKGDLLEDNPAGNFTAIVDKAVAAAKQVTDLQRTVHCSFGDFTTQQYLWQANFFRTLRAYDIAKLIGIDPTLPPELTKNVYDELAPQADEWRKMGVFPPALPVADNADVQTKLLALTGRQP